MHLHLLLLLSAAVFLQLTTNAYVISGMKKPSMILRMSSVPPEFIGAKKFSQKDKDIKTVLSSEQISKILPHRYPFLLLDRVVEFEPGKR